MVLITELLGISGEGNVKLKQEHWFCVAFAVFIIVVLVHQKVGYQSQASVNVDNALFEASITSAAFA